MAIFPSLSYALFLLLPLLFSGHGSEGRRTEDAGMAMNHVLQMRSLVSASTCSRPLKEQVGSVPLVHRHGPCSPLPEERLRPRNSTLIFLRDQSRVSSFRPSLASSYSSSKVYQPTDNGDDLRVPVTVPSPGAGIYVVTVGFGTPRRDLPLMLDTGSALTWTRCLPCTSQGCCDEQDRCFQPSKSSTYSNPPCSASRCNYSVSYKDKSFSDGYMVQDTLTISPSYQFPRFLFGCGQNIGVGFVSLAGVLGLAQGDASLVAQTESKFAYIFCYCIPPTSSSQGYLLFGFGALKNCQREQSRTKILSGSNSSLYYVKLLGITIGNRRLDISKQISSSSPSRTTIIDSGTTITRLPPSVYSALRDEFKKQMVQYPVSPALPPLLDTCYNLKGRGTVAFPDIILNFDGTNVNVDPSGVVWRESDSQVCLAFAANDNEDDLIIIGSTQQRKLSILYNIQDERVEFGTGSCGS